MESKYIDLLSDLGFKKIFGKEGVSEEFLIDFLNELFHDDPELRNIVSIRYKNGEKSPNHVEEKASHYDIFCETDTGHRFIVEMQKQNKLHFRDRVTYYMSRDIVEQGIGARTSGGWNYDLIPVVGVFLTAFFVEGLDKKLVVHGRFVDPSTGKTVLDKMRCVFIQLSAFNKSADECESGFDKWIYVLKNMEKLQDIPFATYKNRIFERVAATSRVATLSEAERMQYDRELKWVRDYNAEMEYARHIGEQKGIAEGRAEGIAEGRAETSLEIARRMKESGMTVEQIAEFTGLPVEKVKAL